MLIVVGCFGLAEAGGKKRVVVLDFDGPKAEKFHDEVEKVVKKNNTIVPTDKWNGTAEELDAGTLNKDNVKKVAKKLKIDAIVSGKVEKRGGDYVIKIKVRDGKTGAVTGGAIEATVENGKIVSASKGDINDLIAGLEVKGGGDDEAKPDDKVAKDDKKKKGKKTDEETEDKPKFSKKDDDARGGDKVGLDGKDSKKKGKKADEEEPRDGSTASKKGKKDDKIAKADDDPPKKEKVVDVKTEDEPKPKKDKKKVASTEDNPPNEEGVEASSGGKVVAVALTPAERAVDVAVGVSFVARRLSFDSKLQGALIPPGYKQTIPVPGALIDATVYPMAISHTGGGITKNVGIAVLFDQVLLIKSQVNNPDGSSTSLATTEQHYSFGGAFRFALGGMNLTATLSYAKQSFSIAHPMGVTVDMPSVSYGMIDPALKIHYPFSDKLTIIGKLGVMLLLSSGDISQQAEYGKTSGYGIEGEVGAEYPLTKSVFARAALRFDTIKLTFDGSGDKTKNRDGDTMTVDVFGARDTYFGAAVTVGYLY